MGGGGGVQEGKMAVEEVGLVLAGSALIVYIKEMAVILPSCHCRLTELTIVSIIN